MLFKNNVKNPVKREAAAIFNEALAAQNAADYKTAAKLYKQSTKIDLKNNKSCAASI